MAFVGYFMYSVFGSKEKLHSEQLLLADLVENTPESDRDASFHKKLDQLGPFEREQSGILTPEATLKLKRAITEKAYREFANRSDELLQERIGYLKTQKQNEYM